MATDAPTTIKQIAEHLGLSATTVSRALSGKARRYRISKKTEASVQDLARQQNFSPNHLAQGLKLNKTSTIGLIIPDISNPFFSSIARQVALGARDRNFSVMLCDSQDDLDLEIRALELLRSRRVDGIVLCPVGQSADHLLHLTGRKVPIVLVDRYFQHSRLPFVASDNYGGALQATSHLIEHGHKQIACLQGLRRTMTNDERLRGYRDALARHQIPLNEALLVGDSFGEQCGYLETKLLLHRQERFTAILAFSNLLALGAVRALAEESLTVPDAISLISFDEQPYSAHLATPLTTVAQRCSEIGELAVRMLFEQIQSLDERPPGGILLPMNLIVRQSVKQLG